MALRMPGMAGFQLLNLHDFPGQGTALVGLLNAFWKSKGIIEPDEFREFCSEVVPLIWMDRAVYSNTDTLKLGAGLANYSNSVDNGILRLELIWQNDQVLHHEKINVNEIPLGKTSRLCEFEIPLAQVHKAIQLTLRLSVEGTTYSNTWPVWVYPEQDQSVQNSGIVITGSFEEAEKALGEGKKVLLNPMPGDILGLE